MNTRFSSRKFRENTTLEREKETKQIIGSPRLFPYVSSKNARDRIPTNKSYRQQTIAAKLKNGQIRSVRAANEHRFDIHYTYYYIIFDSEADSNVGAEA